MLFGRGSRSAATNAADAAEGAAIPHGHSTLQSYMAGTSIACQSNQRCIYVLNIKSSDKGYVSGALFEGKVCSCEE